MRMSWLLCVLLGTFAWGQAAPSSAPPPQMAPAPGADQPKPQAPPDSSAAVPADAAVITVNGVCPAQPKTAAAKATTAKSATAPPATKAAADCKTVITKAQFEKLASSVAPSVTPQLKKQLAGVLPRLIAMSAEAKKQGLDKTPQFEETVRFAKMQILTNELQRRIQDQAAKVEPADIAKYYKDHPEGFEQFNVDRIFVPRTKQAEAEAKEQDEKDEKAGEEAQKVKEAEEKAKTEAAEQEMTKMAETLRARAAAGEDFLKLQKEAFDAAGMKIESPTVNLPNVRHNGLPPAHAAVFDLKVGDVSQVISDTGGHYIYKVNSKSQIPLDQASSEIRAKVQSDRTRELMDKVNNSFKVETNEAYFPGGVGTAPPPRLPHPRSTPPPVAPAQQPPAAKPN